MNQNIKVLKEIIPDPEYIEIQYSDGLETLRQIPIIRDFVPSNQRGYTKFAAKLPHATLLITSDAPLELNKKFDLSTATKTYLGVLPISFDDEGYYCSVDCIQLS